MRSLTRALTLSAALTASACDDPTAPSVEFAPAGEAGLAAGLELPPPIRSGLLPAYETAEERAVKDDSIDYRASFQELYGYTGPPARARAVAEFEPTDGVVVTWAGELSPFFLDLTEALVDTTTVYLVTPSLGYSAELKAYLRRNGVDAEGIEFLEYEHEAFWARDYGPWTVETGADQPAWIDPRYYPERRRDDALPTLLGRHLAVDVYRPDLSVEGGNFMTNGAGFCAATEWIVQQNWASEREIKDTLRRYAGCDQTLIVERLDGEGTGHIDMFAKFTSADTVLVGEYDPRAEPTNAALLDRNARRFADAGFRVVRIPMPQADWDAYRSYTNALFVNNTVIMPTYDTDRRLEAAAVDAYEKALPAGYRVVKVDASEIIYYGGAVHCVTMSFNRSPLGTRPPTVELDAEQPEPQPVAAPIGARSQPASPIRDLRRTTDALQVAQSQTVSAVEIELDIEHTYVADLLVYVEHDGQKAVLHEYGGGSADDIVGSFSTRAFEGADSAGSWTLVIEDRAEQDEGTLRAWSLSIR